MGEGRYPPPPRLALNLAVPPLFFFRLNKNEKKKKLESNFEVIGFNTTQTKNFFSEKITQKFTNLYFSDNSLHFFTIDMHEVHL